MKQLALENNWHRPPVSVCEPGQDSDLMSDGSLPARQRFEFIHLAQRQGQLSVAELFFEVCRLSTDAKISACQRLREKDCLRTFDAELSIVSL
jgi:hypothetical protein